MAKIKFDLAQLDNNGFIGPTDGKRTLAFEFCIPDSKRTKQAIVKIDSTIQFSNSPGRIGCTNTEILCLGETNTKYKRVLKKISDLEYVKEIRQTYFE